MEGRVTRLDQTIIYFKKQFRIFFHERGWTFVLFGAIISFMVMYVTGPKMFNNAEGTKSGLFSVMSACLWIGIFNSIQKICKERDIIKHEHMTGMHISSYVFAHMLYQAVICFMQAIIMLIAYNVFADAPSKGIMFSSANVEYLITMFLIIYSADAMGIAISSCVKTADVAMTVMPFFLIVQLILSGVLFSLSGVVENIAYITIGKWAMAALGSIARMNDIPLNITLQYPQLANQISRGSNDDYTSTAGHLLWVWLVLLILTLVCVAVSIVRLKFIDKE